MRRKILKWFREFREFWYGKILMKPRVYFYPALGLDCYGLEKDLSGIGVYRDLRFCNFELVDFLKKLRN